MDVYLNYESLLRAVTTIQEAPDNISTLRIPAFSENGFCNIVIDTSDRIGYVGGRGSAPSIDSDVFSNVSMTGYYEFVQENSFGDCGEDEPQQKPTLKQLMEELE